MGMMLEISRAVADAILAEAGASPVREVCGLLLGTGARIDGLLPCDNVAAAPCTRFEIDPRRLVAAHRAARHGGPGIVGCYHSHPRGAAVPSPADAADAAPDGWVWLIAARGDIGVWRAVEQGEHLGRFDTVDWRVV